MRIKTLDSKDSKRVFGMIAGKPGSGKTTQATTFPKKETLIVSVEDGLLSLAGSGFAYIEAQDYAEILEVIQNPPKWVKYLFIDSLTEIYDMLKKELSDKFTRSQNFAKHEEMTMKLLYLLRKARQSPIDTFITCHVKTEKSGLDLVDELAFDGKMPSLVKKQFDLILHLISEENDEGGIERYFKTSPEISNIAKKRVSPWLKIKIKDKEEANLYKLTNKLKGLEQ